MKIGVQAFGEMRWLVVVFAIAVAGCEKRQDGGGHGAVVGQVLGHPDELERRGDGLMYVRGADEPFGGVVMRESRGVPRYFASYREGVLHGPEMRWSDGGALERIFDYEFGEKVRDRRYYQGGGRKLDALMSHGRGHGPHRKWHEDGAVDFVGEMLPGVGFHGSVVVRAEDGELLADCVFSHGKYVTGYLDESEIAAKKAAGVYPDTASNERASEAVELLEAAPVLAVFERPSVGGVPMWWTEEVEEVEQMEGDDGEEGIDGP